MFETFYPDETIHSAYEVDYEKYYEAGYRAIIYDIDNTLVMHGAPATKEAIELFERLKSIGYKVCVLSNNKEERVKSFASELGCYYIYKANKPSKRGYIAAMRRLGTNTKNTLFIGDQLFTDVWGAKRLGIHNILVDPIDPKEEIQIVLKRYLEKIVLRSYKKKCATQNDKKED